MKTLTSTMVGKQVKVREGWEGAGRLGRVVSEPVYLEQWWVGILWDGEDDPDFFKLAGAEEL